MPSDNSETFSEKLTIIKRSFTSTNRVKTQSRALHSEKEIWGLSPGTPPPPPPGNWLTQNNNPEAVPDWQPFITK